ncbi:alanine racemase [Alicyclobacillus hesperidum URH17-3-68]|nr:alanine racemase [Alicyclobacillus hesperidum URH17-3-68]
MRFAVLVDKQRLRLYHLFRAIHSDKHSFTFPILPTTLNDGICDGFIKHIFNKLEEKTRTEEAWRKQ